MSVKICDAFHQIWELFAGYDHSIAATYFLQEQPHLIERVLQHSRLDVLPLDKAASDFGDFTEKYTFFKCDVSASDNAVVKNGQLHFTSYSYAALYIPPLNFGSLREMTVSFYFSIDNLGEVSSSVQKRFGFRLGQLEIYFMPDTDIADIAQFRRCYTLIGGQSEPQMEYLDEAAFLEGELMRVVFQIHQDHMSSMHLCKTAVKCCLPKRLGAQQAWILQRSKSCNRLPWNICRWCKLREGPSQSRASPFCSTRKTLKALFSCQSGQS